MPSKSLQTIYFALIYLHFTYCNLIWASTYVTTYDEFIYNRKEQYGRSLKLTTRLQVNLFLQIQKFLMFLVSTLYKSVVCTYIIMMLYLFLLLKSFKRETRFINIQHDTLTFTDLIPVEQILKKFRFSFKVLEYGIHCRTTSKIIFKGQTEC